MDTKEITQRLSPITVSMIRHWQRKDEKGCYREFFALAVEDRRLVEETFKQASKTFPTKAARRDAKGIYKLIKKNFEKEVSFMMDITEKLLINHWIMAGKESFYTAYLGLAKWEQEMFLEALKEFADSESAEFRQAVKDIPAYIQSKS